MNETESYPASDVTAQQVESLIKTTADLQTQILRKFAKSVLEEMRYHLYVAQEKCKMGEETIATLSATIEIERAAMLARLADDADELRRLREMYWVLRDCFPIASGDKNADILEKIKAIQETIEDAGDISEPD